MILPRITAFIASQIIPFVVPQFTLNLKYSSSSFWMSFWTWSINKSSGFKLHTLVGAVVLFREILASTLAWSDHARIPISDVQQRPTNESDINR